MGIFLFPAHAFFQAIMKNCCWQLKSNMHNVFVDKGDDKGIRRGREICWGRGRVGMLEVKQKGGGRRNL